LRASLASQAQALNVRATFLGFCNQSRLPGVYAAADLLVLPSDSTETWGLVVNEAMACGTPCVVSDDCGCAPDMISPGTGRSFRTGDVQALAAAIEAVMDDPQGLEAALLAKCAAYSTHAAAAGIIHGAMQSHAPLTSPQNVHET
jgi:glycosyltransferase involved in cell wall biosynthesis